MKRWDEGTTHPVLSLGRVRRVREIRRSGFRDKGLEGLGTEGSGNKGKWV